MMKLQLSVITIMFLSAMTTISSTSKDNVVVRNNNTQNAEEILALNPSQGQNKQRSQGQQDAPQKVQNKISKYPGVSWKADNKKWLARLAYKGNVYYGGLFDFEEHAAMKINLLCDKHEIERKNPVINIEPEAIIQHVKNQNQTSKYNGVTWRKDNKKWKAQLPHKGKKHYGGLFDIEEHAAMMVNLLCDKYEIERKNTMVNIKLDQIQRIQNQTSKYNGVCWNQDYKKWKAQLHYKGKTYYGGLFDNEEHAAMGVNLLCLKFGIKRKNLRINMNKDAIRQGSLTKRMNVKSAQKDAKYVKIVNRSNYDNSVPPNLETKDNEDIDLNTMEIRKEQDDNCDTSVELEEKEENDDDKETHFFDEEEEEDDDDESDHNYDPSANCEFVKNQISKYTGFTRKTDCKKRQVQSNHKVKNNHGRLVEIEQDAAMKVDLLCDNYKRKRKNATTKIQQDAIHRNHRPTSQYTGVQWHKDAKKWQAILSNKGKQYYGGVFDNEEHAAMKINLLCDKCGIERKNTTINIELDKIIQHAQNKTSKYTGVRWRKDNKKWEARLTNKEKWYYGGLFDIEEHAAMKVNLLCDKCEIKRKNPGIKIELDVIIQHVQNPTSKYNGVSRHKATKKWEAKFTHNQKIYYGGLFDKEEDAAMEVNLLCDKCKIERRNTMINIGQDLIQQVQNQTSKYIGIVWKEDKKKWQVELTHNKMICTGNCFDNEKRAAMAANLLCDFLCIERKNPMINIDLNEKTPQKTKSQNKKYCE